MEAELDAEREFAGERAEVRVGEFWEPFSRYFIEGSKSMLLD